MSMAGAPVDAMAGLAEAWEENVGIRRKARNNKLLLSWPSATTVGIATLKLASRKPEVFLILEFPSFTCCGT